VIINSVLSLVVFWSTNCNHHSVFTFPLHSLGFGTLVSSYNLCGCLLSGIDNMHFLILVNQTKHWAIMVPLHGPWDCGVAGIVKHRFFRLNIPYLNSTTNISCCQSVLSRWMPLNERNFLTMFIQISIKLIIVSRDALIRNWPKLDSAISWGCGEKVSMEWGECQVLNLTFMSCYLWLVWRYFAKVINIPDDEWTTATLPGHLYRNYF